MVAYGDTAAVRQMLVPSGVTLDATMVARIEEMREVASRLLDEATGRTFGAVAVARQIVVPVASSSPVLTLPLPAVAITEIRTGFTDEAGVISGGTALASSGWTVALRDGEGNITAIRAAAWWYGYGDAVAITATWADGDTDAIVPADIDWATNYITAKSIAEEQASPAGFVGPDGSVVPIRNPWTEPKVKAVIARHRLVTKKLVV